MNKNDCDLFERNINYFKIKFLVNVPKNTKIIAKGQ